jgi:hypothetical protein
MARILISPEIRSAHINPFEREHDKRVLAMRIQIEEKGGFKNLTWLSDYEMRCGLRMNWKRALMEGRGWDLTGAKLHRVYSRTPDGYFGGEIAGDLISFVLEYEHSPYNRKKMSDMVLNLTRMFPEVYRLIVSRDRAHTIRMMNGLETFIKNDFRYKDLWGFSFYEKVERYPFIRVPWAKLGGGFLPFVKDPILKVLSPEELAKEIKDHESNA